MIYAGSGPPLWIHTLGGVVFYLSHYQRSSAQGTQNKNVSFRRPILSSNYWKVHSNWLDMLTIFNSDTAQLSEHIAMMRLHHFRHKHSSTANKMVDISA